MIFKNLLLFLIFCVKLFSCEEKAWSGPWFPRNPNEKHSKVEEKSSTNESGHVWKGKYFPHPPHPKDLEKAKQFKLKKHPNLIPMGIPNPVCDDAKSNLATDFDPDDITFHEEFLCMRSYKQFMPNTSVKARHLTYNIPKGYRFRHICMNETIEYKENIPSYGNHRALWAAWGEYKFLPKQRWVHNLEHGGIVMLYHTCALHSEVQKLREIVENCLYRHIITPYSDLTAKRPLAIVAWGNTLEMSVVSPEIVLNFIKKYALQAPEKIPDQGQYQHLLIKNATIISDFEDSKLCPYQSVRSLT
ncbi:uncharacterized protein LOC134830621 isoform X2 [Culicoides brevitarsis]|uniref:uncharacterized protein LOC134830621 isoform X2 n=1 Tax=Culicoides brevitarsis TaxID=469753 RepID=UPI00307C4B58